MIYSPDDMRKAIAMARKYIEFCDKDYKDSQWREFYLNDAEFCEKVEKFAQDLSEQRKKK